MKELSYGLPAPLADWRSFDATSLLYLESSFIFIPSRMSDLEVVCFAFLFAKLRNIFDGK